MAVLEQCRYDIIRSILYVNRHKSFDFPSTGVREYCPEYGSAEVLSGVRECGSTVRSTVVWEYGSTVWSTGVSSGVRDYGSTGVSIPPWQKVIFSPQLFPRMILLEKYDWILDYPLLPTRTMLSPLRLLFSANHDSPTSANQSQQYGKNALSLRRDPGNPSKLDNRHRNTTKKQTDQISPVDATYLFSRNFCNISITSIKHFHFRTSNFPKTSETQTKHIRSSHLRIDFRWSWNTSDILATCYHWSAPSCHFSLYLLGLTPSLWSSNHLKNALPSEHRPCRPEI